MYIFKSKRSARLISAILALGLLLTCVPGYAGAVDPSPIVVDFQQTVTTASSPYTITSTPGYTVNWDKSVPNASPSIKRIVTLPGTEYKAMRFSVAGRMWQDAVVKGGVQNAMFTINVDVPTAGYYIPKVQGGIWWQGAMASIYIDDIYAGDYNFWSGNATAADATAAGFVGGNDAQLGTEKALNGFNLTAGSHEISFRSRWRHDTNAAPYFLLHKLTLAPAEAATLSSVAVTGLSDTISFDGSAAISAQAIMSDSSAHHFGLTTNAVADTENYITVTSSNPSVIAVSNIVSVKVGEGDTMTATLTPAAAYGFSDITVTAKVGDITKTSVRRVTIESDPDLPPQQVVVDFTQTTTTSASPFTIIDTPGYTVNWAESTELINRAVTMPDTNKALRVNVTTGGNLSNFWPETEGEETNKRVKFTINVDVPIAGYFVPKLQGGTWAQGVIASVYMDGKYAGDYNFWSGRTLAEAADEYPGGNDASLGAEKELNGIYLTAGNHEISFRARWSTNPCTTPYLVLHKLTLVPSEQPTFASVSASAIEDTLDVGDTENVTAQAMLSNEKAYQFGLAGDGTADAETYITMTSSNPSVIAVEDLSPVRIGASDTMTATLVPVAAGSATVTVTAKIGETTKTAVKTITVKNAAIAPTQTSKLLVTSADATIGGIAATGATQNIAIGTEMNLTAPMVGGKKFLYWKNTTTGLVLSDSASYTFKLGANTTITAVYAEDAAGSYSVVFKNANGEVIKSETLASGATITAPALPTLTGYGTAHSWDNDATVVGTEDILFTARYTVPAASIAINVTNGTGGGTYAYDELVTVEASGAPEGQVFSHWTKNGQLVSYDTTYSFYAWENATLMAVFADAAIAKAPVVTLASGVRTENGVKSYLSELAGFGGYAIIDSGIIFGDTGVDLSSYAKKATSKEHGAQFIASIPESDSFKARAYVIYSDGADIRVAYSAEK